jgi:hypothetical protein
LKLPTRRNRAPVRALTVRGGTESSLMKILLVAVAVSAASLASLADAGPPTPADSEKPGAEFTAPMQPTMSPIPVQSAIPDARSVASDAEVGEARRAYRASCERTESAGFCECLTAGVAQALPPSDVRVAARTLRERITAQGDAPASSVFRR